MTPELFAAPQGELLLDASGLQKKLDALRDQILHEFGGVSEKLALIGIQTRGALLARRLAAALREKLGCEVPVGTLDITLYRDDVHDIADQPEVKETELPFDLQDRALVVVDDVLFTGRTVRSAMNAIVDYGRPRVMRLAVLIDRGHRELPIQADFVGLTVQTQRREIVDVNVRELDEEDSVRLIQRPETV